MSRALRASSLGVLAGVCFGFGCGGGDAGLAPIITPGGGTGSSSGTGGSGLLPGTGGGVPVIVGQTCGNGLQDAGEACDDVNDAGGDGCSQLCQIEAGYTCPAFGVACTRSAVCGDGILDPTEACDDLNTLPGDGCNETCTVVDPGWLCRVPGKACVVWCGDGVITPPENCDDSNINPSDGCSPGCLTEPGWSCVGATCTQSDCGNGVPEAGESCDKGADNGLFYGDPANPGCSKTCTLEPSCRPSGVTQACQTFCGDGNIDTPDGEACDDGNRVDGDGCSSLCATEGGFSCPVETASDTQACAAGECLVLPVVYRDFDGQNVVGGHPDFFFYGATVNGVRTTCVPNASGNPVAFAPNGACTSSDSTELCTGLVEPTLNAQGKPEFNAAKGGLCSCRFTDWDGQDIVTAATPGAVSCSNVGGNRYRVGYETPLNVPVLHSAQSFREWYTDSAFSTAVRGTIDLAPVGGGQYRFSSSGGLTVSDDIHSACVVAPTTVTGSLTSGFFPLDDQARAKTCNIWPYWNAALPANCCAGAGCPVASQWDPLINYGSCAAGTGGPVPPSANGKLTGSMRNFYFTTEVRYLFRYDGVGGSLSFYGDDDVWVFVNGRLALDLGGTHERLEGTVNINPANAATYGLEQERIYEIAVFHADQHPRESNYQLTLSGFGTTHSACLPTCGDGVRAAGEECDEGALNQDGVYGACSTLCKYGAFCGDANVDVGFEACDAGRDNGTVYTPTNVGACTTGCQPAHFCGDRIIDASYGEACDDGGPSGSCTDLCQLIVR